MKQDTLLTAPAEIRADFFSEKIETRPPFNVSTLVLGVLIAATALAIVAALRLGWAYYLAPLAQRPQHPLHQTFKSGGLLGEGFGVIGGLLCLMTLLYPLRKRWRRLENFGAPRTWFQFHIYCGITGPLFATLHTTFKFGGLASICYWSMMLVMASGFIGRFLFALMPRNQRGVVLSLKEIDAEIKAAQQFLETAGLRQRRVAAAKIDANWLTLFRLWLGRRRELRAWHQRLRAKDFSVAGAQRIFSLLSRKLFLESSRLTLDLTTRAFSHWHTLHLPFTYVMFITLIIHAGLAIFLGYTWIF